MSERPLTAIARLLLWFALLALPSCGDANPPEVGPETIDNTPFPCEQACPQSFACDDGVCVPSCDPQCPAGTACQLDGSCAATLSDGPSDAVQLNPCGGPTALEGLPGDPCGPCGDGRFVCQSESRLVCVDPVGLNRCGGCGEIPADPGEACDDGRWGCTLDNELVCSPSNTVNDCGGVEALEHPPGRPCGACNAGAFVCDGPNRSGCRDADPAPAPATCMCDPDETPWLPCGTDVGACGAGVRPCLGTGTWGPCVSVPRGAECATDAECEAGFCLQEAVHPFASLQDDCVEGDEAACARSTCRDPSVGVVCGTNDDCDSRQACAGGFCLTLAPPATDERCNGIDDDCDGLIDNDDRREEICGVCPFNTLLITNVERDFGRRRVCVDVIEATRLDATDIEPGVRTDLSLPRFGVLPWEGATPTQAIAACGGKGYNEQIPGGVVPRRLCVRDEWRLACGASDVSYPYGDTYVAGSCNDAAITPNRLHVTANYRECAYIQPRGRFPHYDVVGNLAEYVRGDDGLVLVGGSYQTSEASCETQTALTASRVDGGAEGVGFRCCSTPIEGNF
ncbi:MAG: hypothetical protein ACI81R_003669 [Bradymonadia bacterium]|jgi:hypothetical protein